MRSKDYLVMIVNSFNQHRIVNLLDLSTTLSLFNFINICNPKRGITVGEQRIRIFKNNELRNTNFKGSNCKIF